MLSIRRSRLSFSVALLLIAFAMSFVSARPARADDPLARVVKGLTFDQFVQKTLRDYGVSGGVVAITGANDPLFVKGYGVRKIGTTARVDEDTRFQIASVTKFVAATAVGTVVDEGKVGWDQPVHTFNPDLVLNQPYATQWVTLRDFFAHRVGLPAYGGDILTVFNLGTPDLVRLARYLTFDRSFREKWQYSNYGIFLGQESVAHVLGLTPADLLQQRILTPLGMTRSGPSSRTMTQDDNHSFTHNIDGSVMPLEEVDAFSGAGAVVSTGADIAKWMQMLLARGSYNGRQILKSETVDQIYASSMVQGVGGPLHDPNDSAGLGCESYHFLQYRVIEKNGALNGMRSIVTLVPEKNIGIAVFANKQLTVFPEAVRAEFLVRYLGPSGVDLQAQISKDQPAWDSLVVLPKPPPKAKPPSHDFGAYAGAYTSSLYGRMTVIRDGPTLRGEIGPNRYAAKFTHYSGDTFLMWFDDPGVEPGLITFTFRAGPNAAGLTGGTVPKSFTIDYGHFERT